MLKKKFAPVAIIISAGMLLSSCASMSTMQTARVTEEGEVGYGFGGGVVNSEIALGEADTIKISAPFVEVGARYGVTEKLDIGLKLTIIGTYVLNAKYQFLGDSESELAGSVGFGLGYLSISSGESSSNIYDLMVPTYFSYHPAEWLGLYVSPKYVFRINSYDDGYNVTGSSTSSWYGMTGGIRIGKDIAFLAEYSYFKNSEIDAPFTQVTCGMAIGIK